jgi:hypothetical protein
MNVARVISLSDLIILCLNYSNNHVRFTLV